MTFKERADLKKKELEKNRQALSKSQDEKRRLLDVQAREVQHIVYTDVYTKEWAKKHPKAFERLLHHRYTTNKRRYKQKYGIFWDVLLKCNSAIKKGSK